MSAKRYWEDFQPGEVAILGPRLVTREEIVAFAAEFDPQPMHLDEAAASATLLGGLGASGWHSCCLLMRVIADGFVNHTHSMGAPGVDEVRWLCDRIRKCACGRPCWKHARPKTVRISDS
jgi:acyl dehydratase